MSKTVDYKAKYLSYKASYRALRKVLRTVRSEHKAFVKAVDKERDDLRKVNTIRHDRLHIQLKRLADLMFEYQRLARYYHLNSNVQDCPRCAYHTRSKKLKENK